MKKIVSGILSVLIAFAVQAQNTIPNPGFESWTNQGFYEDPDNWGTINSLTSIVLVTTATKATGANAHSGSYALKLESKNVAGQGTAPGIAATGSINAQTQAVDGGVAFHRRPISFTGWYKYIPNGIDTGSIDARLWRWNNTTHTREEIGTAEFVMTTTVNSYTQFTATFNYVSAAFPDSMVITLLTSSRAQGSPTGTQLFVDDLGMVMCSNFTAAASSATPSTCGQNGSAAVTTNNGAGEYSYNWSNGGNTSSINAAAGNYHVTVTDGNGCTAASSTTITTAIGSINVSATSTSAQCTSSTGSVTVTPNSGTGPYSYLWSLGSSNATTQSVNNIAAGTYPVTVTDNFGCTGSATATVSALQLTITSIVNATGTSCASSTGSVTVTPNNGTANYNYSWTNGGTTQTISNLPSGSYTVTITDANGCTGTASGSVTTPNGPQATASVSNITCNGAGDGAIDVTTTGGTGTVTYNWNNNATVEDLTTLPAGTYTLTVNDVNNCSFTLSATVTEPAAVTGTISPTNITCFGLADGSATVNVNGGNVHYSYLWSNSQTGNTATALNTGTVTLTVTDNNNCSASFSTTISQPAALTVSETHLNVTCNGESTGSIDLTVSGGTTGYSYVWAGLSGNGAAQNNLAAGTYTATITDANSCTATTSVTLTEPSAIALNLTATNTSAQAANDGGVTTSTSGGVAPYSYTWSNSSVSANLTNVGTGQYCVTVADANTCTVTACATVDAPSAITGIAADNIKVYPNPASNFIVIETAATSVLTIYTLEGKVVSQTVVNAGKANVSVNELPAALYTYTLKNNATGKINGGNLLIER